mgnify:CR=1 FL=1
MIALDAGHGGEDSGARGAAGSLEKNITLSIARKLKKIIDDAAKPPAPSRKKSQPTRASVKRRLEGKRHASKKKESRRTSDW